MNKSFALLVPFFLLGGCQNLPHPADDTHAATQESTPPPATSTPRRYASFSEDSLYALLTAELAGQRDRFDIALNNYSEQARITRDPAVAERAYRIAEYLGAEQAALDNALIWAKTAPDSIDAQRASAIQLARAGRYDQSMQYMEAVLQAQGDTHFDFLALSAAESDADTRAGLLQSFDRLLQKHPQNGQLLFGKALLLQQDNQPEAALQVLESQPAASTESAALLLRVRLLQSLQRGDEALPLLQEGLQQSPDDKRLRLAYARALVEQKQLAQARDEFAALLLQYPEDDDLRLSLALVCLEAQAWDEAQTYLRELVERDSHADVAHYHLGQIHEQQQDPEGALIEYSLVGPGNSYLPAQARQASILIASGRGQDARSRLAQARIDQPDFAIQLYLLESESLAEHQQTEQAWQTIEQGLLQFPDDINLLYTRAMLAEKRGDLAQLERDLRQVLAREPDNSMALNALGYTLADRTTRYAEARALIERAYQLDPEDPAILDSLGWVHFRLGNLQAAEELLRQALQRFPDHEIAAHLGEVLWASGKQDEARSVWREALNNQPDSPILRSTLLRLTGSESL